METETETEIYSVWQLAEIYSVWQLAQMADVASPDRDDSPGAKWLENVASDARDMIEEGYTDEDSIHERADSAVPIYTHERWQVFVDLAAYNEDTSDFGEPEDLTQAAGIALYMVAHRLIRAILDEHEEETEDEEADEEPEE